MKHSILLPILISAALLIGCTSIKPLTLRHYSKNIIARKDKTLYIENEQIDFRNLKQELVKRLVTTTTPIALHIHKDLPGKSTEAIIKKLEVEGFNNVQILVFRD